MVKDGWSPPIDVDDKNNEIKKKCNWSLEDTSKANANEKALNAIFGKINENQFKYVAIFESTKEDWDIFQKNP